MKILCEISVRHIHMCQSDFEKLFGEGKKPEWVRDLSQPGEFLSAQRVDIVGPKRTIESVSILGPLRTKSQVEISRTDCFTLGLKDVPLRQSGDLDGSPGVILRAGDKDVVLKQGVIIAKRHVHLDPKTARDNGFKDGQTVKLIFGGERGGVLNGAVVRVGENYLQTVHIDSDEGNAVFCSEQIEIQSEM